MEIIVELVLGLLQILAEVILQIIFEALAELGLRSLREPFRRPEPLHPWLAAIGYSIFGAIAGGISVWVMPNSFITAAWLRVVNLVVTPIALGGLMAAIGAWRRRRDEEVIRIDRFAYGYLFALGMALVRFNWAD